MSTNNQYKLPTDIESRFVDKFTVSDEDDDGNEIPVLSLLASTFVESDESIGELTEFLATEQVTLLEWMLGEIGKMKMCVDESVINYYEDEDVAKRTLERNKTRNKLIDDVIAKVQAKLQEYKV